MAFTSVDGVALVTGAAAGIGQEVGYAFAEAASAEKSKEFATNLGYRGLAFKVDTKDPESVQAMVDFVVKEFSRIDYSVGATSLAPNADLDIDNFDATLVVNVKGVMLCVWAVSKVMLSQEPRLHKGRHGIERSLGHGSIINLASAMSYVAGPGMMAYAASKHALIGITKVAALDNAKHLIRVNALCPLWVATPMLDRSREWWPALDKVIEKVSPAGRPATPEEVANMAVFMCSHLYQRNTATD